MKNKFILFYSIFASAIFLFSIIFLSVNIYKEYSYGEARTSTKFNTITTEIRNQADNISSTTIISNLNSSFSNYNDFADIVITIDNKDLLRYPSHFVENNSSGKLTKKYKSSIQTRQGTFSITADMYLLRPYSIFYYAKISFFLILVVTCITIILLIYLNMNKETISATEDEIDEYETDEITENENIDEAINIITENENEVIESPDSIDDNQNIEESDSDTDSEKEKDTVILPSVETKPIEISNEQTKENPEGLFNPASGLGWEQYLLTRLDSEINRAIASEIDLSLFIIQIPNEERTSEIIKNVANTLSIQFQFKDLIFEYKEDCFAGIMISMDIDQALDFADRLYQDIEDILNSKNCYIGISSRSIRMVSGERILHEAEEALLHAKEDTDSPIIAFRVDAEKYRKFLENND